MKMGFLDRKLRGEGEMSNRNLKRTLQYSK